MGDEDVGDRCQYCILSAPEDRKACVGVTRRTRKGDAELMSFRKGRGRSETDEDVRSANQWGFAHRLSAIIGTINLRLR
ncbi:hypothetical protein DXT90_02240 [Agrobacterium tumefaciens]|nr:hypothetical protein [Agrobacterium tumefaciens]